MDELKLNEQIKSTSKRSLLEKIIDLFSLDPFGDKRAMNDLKNNQSIYAN